MIKNTLLATRPNGDFTTRYISAWAGLVLDLAREKSFRVLDLDGDRANRLEFESMLKKHCPAVIFLNGHGSDSSVMGQREEVLVDSRQNLTILAGTIVYALSCRSAKILGPESIKYGVSAYLGYAEDFVFLFTPKNRMCPLEDKTATLFLALSNQIMISLLEEKTASETHRRGKQSFLRNIQKLLTSQSSMDDSAAVRYLVWDMQYLVCHGDMNAKR